MSNEANPFKHEPAPQETRKAEMQTAEAMPDTPLEKAVRMFENYKGDEEVMRLVKETLENEQVREDSAAILEAAALELEDAEADHSSIRLLQHFSTFLAATAAAEVITSLVADSYGVALPEIAVFGEVTAVLAGIAGVPAALMMMDVTEKIKKTITEAMHRAKAYASGAESASDIPQAQP